MLSINAVANTFLKKAFKTEQHNVTPMKLQKLVYFAYREYLQKTGCPLFEECFSTWKYGPVVKCLYDEFKSFGKKPITRFYKDAQGKAYCLSDTAPVEVKTIFDNVWDKFNKYDGIELSEMTHQEGTAWYKAYMNERPILNIEDIRNEPRC